MRPKDLKSTFNWETREPSLEGQILYVPDYYFKHEKFVMPPMKSIFNNTLPVVVEYCSGNGDWIAQKAKEHPEKNWIAVEKLFERVRKIHSKRENMGLKNLFIVCGEASAFTKYYLKDGIIEEAYINFPDPWPKPRHAKHRLIKSEFVKELSRVLSEGAFFKVVTDDDEYSDSIIQLMLDESKWRSSIASPYFSTDVEGYGYSFFEDLWKKKGKKIRHMQFVKAKMTTSPLICCVESSGFSVDGKPWEPIIADYFSDYNPKIHNTCRVYVDLSMESSLDFSLAKKSANEIIRQGGRVFWDLYLDIPNQLNNLRFEGLFNIHYESLKLFTQNLWTLFQESTIGCSLLQTQVDLTKIFKWSEGDFVDFIEWLTDVYKTPQELFETEIGNLGQINSFDDLSIEMFEVTPFSRHLKNLYTTNLVSAYLHRLAASLPEDLLVFINLDTRNSLHEGFLYQILSKERFSHLQLALNQDHIPIESLNMKAKETKIGICFPNDPFCFYSVLNQFKKLFLDLKKQGISYRIIPEFLMTSSWDGLDEVIFLHKALSPQGKRILQGFSVAGGSLIYLDTPIGFDSEMSYEEFLKSRPF